MSGGALDQGSLRQGREPVALGRRADEVQQERQGEEDRREVVQGGVPLGGGVGKHGQRIKAVMFLGHGAQALLDLVGDARQRAGAVLHAFGLDLDLAVLEAVEHLFQRDMDALQLGASPPGD